MLPSDSLFKKRICAWSEHFIRSEPKTALFGSRPLKESSGRAQILAEKGDWRRLLALLIARGENRLFSPEEVRPICFCGTNCCTVRKADSYNTSLSPAAKDDLQSKNKSRLAAGDAPVQVASL